jgi:hypothetical protein
MPKSGLAVGARRKRERRFVELTNAIEGQIAELCRDLAVEAKRLRQLQEQADELQRAISLWSGRSEADSGLAPANRARRR